MVSKISTVAAKLIFSFSISFFSFQAMGASACSGNDPALIGSWNGVQQQVANGVIVPIRTISFTGCQWTITVSTCSSSASYITKTFPAGHGLVSAQPTGSCGTGSGTVLVGGGLTSGQSSLELYKISGKTLTIYQSENDITPAKYTK